MGRLALFIYLDTAPLIYLIEQYGASWHNVLSATDALVVSDLSRLECRVKPMRFDCVRITPPLETKETCVAMAVLGGFADLC